jgi:hypothetical protein
LTSENAASAAGTEHIAIAEHIVAAKRTVATEHIADLIFPSAGSKLGAERGFSYAFPSCACGYQSIICCGTP